MVISVSIQLAKDDNLAYTPDAAATQVIAALGGNPQNDYCTVYVQSAAEPGSAGTPPEPTPP